MHLAVLQSPNQKKKKQPKKKTRGKGREASRKSWNTKQPRSRRAGSGTQPRVKKKNRDTGMHKHTQWHDQQTPRACGLTSPSTHDPPRASGPCCVRPFRLRSSGFSSSNVSLDNQKHTHTYLPKKKKTGFDNVLFNSPATE
jgi:hypothetical protein